MSKIRTFLTLRKIQNYFDKNFDYFCNDASYIIDFFRKAVKVFNKDDLYAYCEEYYMLDNLLAVLLLDINEENADFLLKKSQEKDSIFPSSVDSAFLLILAYVTNDKEVYAKVGDFFLELFKWTYFKDLPFTLDNLEETLIAVGDKKLIERYFKFYFSFLPGKGYFISQGVVTEDTTRNKRNEKVVERRKSLITGYILKNKDKTLASTYLHEGINFLDEEELTSLFDMLLNTDNNLETEEDELKEEVRIKYAVLDSFSSIRGLTDSVMDKIVSVAIYSYRLPRSRVVKIWVERVVKSGNKLALRLTREKLSSLLDENAFKDLFHSDFDSDKEEDSLEKEMRLTLESITGD